MQLQAFISPPVSSFSNNYHTPNHTPSNTQRGVGNNNARNAFLPTLHGVNHLAGQPLRTQRSQKPSLVSSLRAAANSDQKPELETLTHLPRPTSPQNTTAITAPNTVTHPFAQESPLSSITRNTNTTDTAVANSPAGISPQQLVQAGAALTVIAALVSSQPAAAADPNNANHLQHLRDAAISLGAGGGAAAWVNMWSSLTAQGLVDSKLSRKIIHLTSAPLFLASWPLYSENPSARFIAAAVPLLQLGRLIVASQDDDSDLASAISRNKNGSELLKGPAMYAGILTAASLAWRNSFPALCAITQMAVGDGLADIVGRNFAPKDGTGRVPWNKDKSIGGTVGYVAGASAATWGMLNWFSSQGFLQTDTPVLPAAFGLSVVCGLIETLPADKIKIDDNISVPLAAAVLGQMLFGGRG